MRVRMTLQVRLLLLVLAAVLPLSALSVWFALREAESTTELTKTQLQFAASIIARNHERSIQASQQLLTAVSQLPGVDATDRSVCEPYFARLREQYPTYGNLGIMDRQGNVVCHASGSKEAINAGDRDYFRRAVSTRAFVVGEFVKGRASGRVVLPFAQPLVERGEVTGVAFAALDLERAADALATPDLPQGARVIIADDKATVLMEWPARPQRQLGRTLNNPAVRALAQRMQSGSGEAVDSSGERRIYAVAVSSAVGGEKFFALVSLPHAQVTQATFRRLQEQIALSLLTLCVGLAAAWWVGRRVIVRPAVQILGAVRKLEHGKLQARVPLDTANVAGGEFARIGSAFNLMAESLQMRQQDLENELGRSRRAFEVLDTVLNSMREGLLAVDTSGNFLLSNRAALDMLPLEDTQVPPEQWPEHFGLFAADGITRFAPGSMPFERALRGERGEVRIVIRNELVPQGRLLRCSYQPLRGQDDTVGGALVVFTDVTELERNTQALRAREQELEDYNRMLQRTADAALAITQHRSMQATLQEVVDQARHVIGTHQAVLSLNDAGDWSQVVLAVSASEKYSRWSDIKHIPPSGHGIYSLVLETAAPLRLTQDELLAHPHWRNFSGHDETHPPLRGLLALPLTDNQGVCIGLLQLSDLEDGSDFTERDEYVGIELAQLASIAIQNARLFDQIRELNATLESRIAERTAELSRQEKRYRALAQEAPEIVWNSDPRGNITFFNRAFYDLVGGEPPDWLGQAWISRVHPDDFTQMRQNWFKARATLEPYFGTRRLLAEDGTWHTTSYRAVPVTDENGEVEFWVGIDSDITALKAIEEALRNSNQELEAFSYSVSHDLRAPLGAIDGFSRALASRLQSNALDEKSRHYLDRIQAGVGKMEQLIEALLQLSRVSRAPVNSAAVDLSALAHETIEALQVQQPQRRVTARVQPDLHTRGDPRLVRVLLENLLGNAWKFTGAREDPLVEVGRDDATGAFFVRDNGVGFDMAYADKLFTAFHRLHSEREFPGTGIGLATVRRVVSRHSGRVWAESAPGRGTTFYFTLPTGPRPA